MKRFMFFLSKLVPRDINSENSFAVKLFYRILSVGEFFNQARLFKKSKWPLVAGNYQVINPSGQLAVCTLTSNNLAETIAKWDNVAIIGTLYTPNLGIEKIILNIISNPNIRYLLICGKDSSVFHAGQALQSLFLHGVSPEKRIINAIGHYPVLQNLSIEKIHHFLKQIVLIDEREVLDSAVLYKNILKLEVKKAFVTLPVISENEERYSEEEFFISLKPVGKRIPLNYDENGFFVIEIDRPRNEIIVKHYYKDNRPGFIIKSHSSEAIINAIIENNLISQMSHAAYLGAELAKAKIALKNNFQYIQDQLLQEKIK